MNREPRGIPAGGEFTTGRKGESDVDLRTEQRDEILARYGLTPDFDERFVAAWEERFAVLDVEQVPLLSEEIRDMMGDPDFGRERGAPTLVVRGDDPDEDVIADANSDMDQVYVSIHTRNGLGNRECWHDGDYDDQCTGCIVDDLKARPDHVDDVDDSFDGTYATFYFTPTDPERMKRALGRQPIAQAQVHARKLLEDMVNGLPPWEVLPLNPKAVAAYEADQLIAQTRFAENPPYGFPPRVGADDLLGMRMALRAVDAGEKPNVESPELARYLSTYLRTEAEAVERARKSDESTRTVEMMDAGELPDYVMATLEDRNVRSHAEIASRAAQSSRERAAASRVKINADLAYLERLSEHEYLRRNAAGRLPSLRTALRWPEGLGEPPLAR